MSSINTITHHVSSITNHYISISVSQLVSCRARSCLLIKLLLARYAIEVRGRDFARVPCELRPDRLTTRHKTQLRGCLVSTNPQSPVRGSAFGLLQANQQTNKQTNIQAIKALEPRLKRSTALTFCAQRPVWVDCMDVHGRAWAQAH